MALTSVIASVLAIVLVNVIAWLGVKFGINFTSVVVRMAKIARGEAVHTTTLVKFIPNFTPSHAITYTN